MKKMISLLAVALLATTFAAGCGKFTKCTEATSPDECKAEKFDKEKDDKGKCKWVEHDKAKKTGLCLEETVAAIEAICFSHADDKTCSGDTKCETGKDGKCHAKKA